MPEMDAKLKNFTASILFDAESECRRKTAETEREREAAIRRAEDEIKAETDRYVKIKTSEIKKDAGRRIFRGAHEDKKTLHARRDAIKRAVAADAAERALAYAESAEYLERLRLAVTEEIKNFNSTDTQIFLRGADCRRLAQSGFILPGGAAHVESRDIKYGGFVAHSASGGVRSDRTIDAALRDAEANFFTDRRTSDG